MQVPEIEEKIHEFGETMYRIHREAYDKGYNDGLRYADKDETYRTAYTKGLYDAWEVTKTLLATKRDTQYYSDMINLFGKASIMEIVDEFPLTEIMYRLQNRENR